MGGKGLKNKQRQYIVEEKIIELVKLRPLLYQKQHPSHHHTLIVANAWKKISKEIEKNEFVKSGPDCSELWSKIWGQYLGFKRKIANKTGKAGGKRPFFRHERVMQEFEDKEYHETTMTNVSHNSEEEDQEETVYQRFVTDKEGNLVKVYDIGDTAADEIFVPTAAEAQAESTSAGETRGSPIPSTSKPNTPTQKSSTLPPSRSHEKRKQSNTNEFEKEMIGILKSSNNRDEFDFFGANLASKIRKLNEANSRASAEVQFKIHELIFNIEKTLPEL